MRGALVAWDGTLHGGRIIPADAESTFLRMRGLSAGPDHPRGCGEHGWRAAPGWLVSGSSPRMRGARRISGDYPRMVGIIPADAGSTGCRGHGPARPEDHPRGCGEHAVVPNDVFRSQGSSPRMRGAQAHAPALQVRVRIIPADAGSTKFQQSFFGFAVDHPRGCGEHTTRITPSNSSAGSSPRMRGAPGDGHQPPAAGRIIPADAGSTLLCWCHEVSPWDHPRGCGEHSV